MNEKRSDSRTANVHHTTQPLSNCGSRIENMAVVISQRLHICRSGALSRNRRAEAFQCHMQPSEKCTQPLLLWRRTIKKRFGFVVFVFFLVVFWCGLCCVFLFFVCVNDCKGFHDVRLNIIFVRFGFYVVD